ncbi:hypothetical protein F5B21DRAFT_347797 [Xylaria acuta]|nr:hypothetical protein F5B21DRAFT_347797 [Xylaria acuta]
MTELQGQDTSHQTGSAGGETPYFGRRVGTGVSTPSVQPTDAASRPLFVIQNRVTGTAGVPSSCPSEQDVEARLADGDDDDMLLSPVSTGSQSPSQHQPPTLLNLPLEIRLEIYAHLLTTPSYSPRSSPPSPSSATSTPWSSSSSPSPAPFFIQQQVPLHPPLHPNILRACRQLHAECTPVLYGSNTFLAHTSLLTTFPSFFSPSHPRKAYAPIRSASLASLVTRYRMRLRLDAEPQFGRDEVTAQFSGKSEVIVEVWQAEWRGAGPDALRLFEGVRGVRTARVTGSTSGFEAYAQWLERAMMAGIGDYVKPFAWEDGDVE